MAFRTQACRTQAISEDEHRRRLHHRQQSQQPTQPQLKRRREHEVQKQQRAIRSPDNKNKKRTRPSPDYAKGMLSGYNQQVHDDNAKLKEVNSKQANAITELKKALAAEKMKLVAEQQESFDTRFEREESINYSCYLLQRMYHDGFAGALKMFTEEYGSSKFTGRCAAPLIVNDQEFEEAVAGGFTAWQEQSQATVPAGAATWS
jgi:hypothetical protein